MTSQPNVLSGRQEPRVRSVPDYVTSAGYEAIELAESAGLYLDPWQQQVLVDALGERADGRFAAFEVGLVVPRQNGKGAVLEARELAGLVLFGERHILHSAHLFKTSRDAFRRILGLFQNTPDLDRLVKRVSNTHGDEGIELTNGCRLSFVTRSKGGGRGLSGDVVILDEAYEVTGEQISAILPTMISRPNPQVWYTSSPALDAVNGEALFALKERGEAGGDDSLAWFDWGQLRGVNLDDPHVWAQANPSLGIRIGEDFLRKMRKAFKSNPEGFAREHLGVWPETAGDVIVSPALWRELAAPDSVRPTDVVFVVDVTPDREHASIMMAGPNADGQMVIGVVDHGDGTDWIVHRCLELKARWSPVAFGLDIAGPGGSLLVELEKAGICLAADPAKPKRGDLCVPTSREVAQAWGMFVDAVRQKQIRHLDELPLNVALSGAKTRTLGDGQAWARKTSAVDISPLVGATLAHWTYLTRVDVIDQPKPAPMFAFG